MIMMFVFLGLCDLFKMLVPSSSHLPLKFEIEFSLLYLCSVT